MTELSDNKESKYLALSAPGTPEGPGGDHPHEILLELEMFDKWSAS